MFGCIFVSRLQTLLPAFGGQSNDRDAAFIRGDSSQIAKTTQVDQNGKDAHSMGKEKRINVLLMGIDQRNDERARGDPARTDSMLLATIDTTNKTAGLLSIPRDLYMVIPDVQIPGQGRGQQIDRINTAHFWGDYLKYPGGGPALAKKTLAYNFGVQVDYFARIDFRGFEKAIDALGGVTINVERPMIDYEYPTEDYETMVVSFSAGVQRMNGVRALQYARTRHPDSDFGRSKRQQQVLLAVRQQALRIDALPKLPSVVGSLGSSFKTDMPVAEMIRLSALVKDIATEDIVTRSIDPTMVTETITPGGADVLLPNQKDIANVIHEVYYGALVRREGARIAILSGVNKQGAGNALAKELEDHGYHIAKVDDADRKDYSQSKLIYHSRKPYTVMLLSDRLGVTSDRIEAQPDPGATADITVILGQDIAAKH